jgi:phosphoribosylaminoimidazole-succinocarboxamide synthase
VSVLIASSVSCRVMHVAHTHYETSDLFYLVMVFKDDVSSMDCIALNARIISE